MIGGVISMSQIEYLFQINSFEFSKYLSNSEERNINYKSNIEHSLVLLIDCHIINDNLFSFDLIAKINKLISTGDVNKKRFLFECKRFIFNKAVSWKTRFLLCIICSTQQDAVDKFCLYLEEESSIEKLLSFYRISSYLIEVVDTDSVLGVSKKSILYLQEAVKRIIRNNFELLFKLRLPSSHLVESNVVLLVEHIPFNPKTGAHLSQINNIIEGLLHKGINVLLMITNEKINFDFISWRKASKKLALYLEEYHSSKQLKIISNQFFNLDVAKSNINAINEFKPSYIIKFGGALESNVFDLVFLNSVPYIYSQFNAQNVPDLDYDLFLSNGKLKENKSKWFDRPIPFNYPITENKTYNDDVKLITVLGGDRLNKLFSAYIDSEIDRFIRVVNKVDSWTFVGSESLIDYFKLNKKTNNLINSGKIKVLGLVSDLLSLYSEYDIFIMPPKSTGGGGGAAIAAGAGLIVLSSVDADCANFLDKKHLIDDFSNLESMIVRYIAEPSNLNDSRYEIQRELIKRKPTIIVDEFISLLKVSRQNFLEKSVLYFDK